MTRWPLIVFGADRRYLHPLCVALVSLARDGGPAVFECGVRVLHTDLEPDDVDRLRAMGGALGLEVTPVRLPEREEAFPVTHWVTSAAYLRLRLAEAVEDRSIVLYLDCDLIAVRDLTPLLDIRLRAPVAAVRNLLSPLVRSGGGLPGHEALGIPGDREYFNSGVMLIDVSRWVDEEIGERCRRFLVDRPEHVRFWDQDALNYVLDDRWQRLPLVDNVLPLSGYEETQARDTYRGAEVLSFEEACALEMRARILHFAGPFKPWVGDYPTGEARSAYRAREERLEALDRAVIGHRRGETGARG